MTTSTLNSSTTNTTTGLVDLPRLNYFKSHVALVGTTRSGKTWTFKRFLCDGMFEPFEEFIYCGPKEQVEEIGKALACYCHTLGIPDTSIEATFFTLSEQNSAREKCMSTTKKKLIFLDDAMIIDSKSKVQTANFVNLAQNYNTLVVVAIHNLFEGTEAKKTRNACVYWVMCNVGPSDLTQALKKTINTSNFSDLATQYARREPFDRVLIIDREQSTCFWAKDYTLALV